MIVFNLCHDMSHYSRPQRPPSYQVWFNVRMLQTTTLNSRCVNVITKMWDPLNTLVQCGIFIPLYCASYNVWKLNELWVIMKCANECSEAVCLFTVAEGSYSCWIIQFWLHGLLDELNPRSHREEHTGQRGQHDTLTTYIYGGNPPKQPPWRARTTS